MEYIGKIISITFKVIFYFALGLSISLGALYTIPLMILGVALGLLAEIRKLNWALSWLIYNVVIWGALWGVVMYWINNQ